ncbi:MAG: DUF2764 family protein [Fibrobacteres bacterium]|nr:DUF2764 family protein [Fibrobacterota bacterium]
MAQQYYYLISGLPGITIDESRSLPSFKTLTDDILPLLSEEDAVSLKLIRTESDIKNLIRILDKVDRPFDNNGNLSEEALEASIKDTSALPACMQRIITSHKESSSAQLGLAPDDEASAEYFNELFSSSDPFIKAYSKFEFIMRNVLAGIAARNFKIPVENVIVGNDSISDTIRKSGSPDFGLSAEYPWVNKLITLPADDPIESEKRIDLLRWSVMDELSAFDGFGSAVVFVFALKLRSAERWKALVPEVGRALTEKLVSETRTRLEELIRI